jgi:nitrate/nitrite-specific signal transduction histidine kinase
VALEAAEDGRLVLTVRDDGPGLGRVAAAGSDAQRLGMNIMRAFAAQLGGGLELPDGAGATLRVAFGAAG